MDPQRDAVYAAEHEFDTPSGFCGRLLAREARALVDDVATWYNLPRIKLVVDDSDRRGGYAEWKNGKATIGLRPDNRATNKLLHELAHLVSEYYFGAKIEDHGREFVGVAGVLYDAYRVIPKDAFARILSRHNVLYRPFRFCTPEMLAGRGVDI